MKILSFLLFLFAGVTAFAQELTYINVYSNQADSLVTEIGIESPNLMIYEDSIDVAGLEDKLIRICTEMLDGPLYTYLDLVYDLNASNEDAGKIKLSVIWNQMGNCEDEGGLGSYLFEFDTPLYDTLKLITPVNTYQIPRNVSSEILRNSGRGLFQVQDEFASVQTFQVISLTGIIKEIDHQAQILDLHGFPAGLYIVQALKNGERFIQKIYISN